MMNNGFILIHRKITNWEWYSDTNVFCAFLHCIFLANWEDKKWRGITIKRGQFFTSIENFSVGAGLTTRQTRTAFDKLKSTNEIVIQTTNNGTMITVCKYDDYQDIKKATDKRTTNETTNERQTDDKRTTTTKEYNTLEEDKKERIKTIISFLNEQAKSNFNYSAKGHATYINARINEGRSVEDFKIVIKDRCARWLNNLQMSEYLRPETLFGSKFDGYLSEATKAGVKISETNQDNEIDKHPLISLLTPLVRSQMTWRDKQDYINAKTPQNA